MNQTPLQSLPVQFGLPQPLRVLVVDDEELARMRLKSLVNECTDPRGHRGRRGGQRGAGAGLAGHARNAT